MQTRRSRAPETRYKLNCWCVLSCERISLCYNHRNSAQGDLFLSELGSMSRDWIFVSTLERTSLRVSSETTRSWRVLMNFVNLSCNQVGIYTMINFSLWFLRDGKKGIWNSAHVNDSICNVIFSEQSPAVMILGCE